MESMSKDKGAGAETPFVGMAQGILLSSRVQTMDSSESSLKGSQATYCSFTPVSRPPKIKLQRFEGGDPP
uniref:Uncharacterized protein n=1 Tax=Rhizophora mucronata TaxID=61149 RepID=A0A2P2R3H8_RHIMU